MTYDKAISRGYSALSGEVGREELAVWLSEIEDTVRAELLNSHEGGENLPDGELFIRDPYSEIYILYFIMKNDARLADTARYLNSASVFGTAYSSFADRYNREHMPKGALKIEV